MEKKMMCIILINKDSFMIILECGDRERIISEDEYIRIMMRMMDARRKKDELQKVTNFIEKKNNPNIIIE